MNAFMKVISAQLSVIQQFPFFWDAMQASLHWREKVLPSQPLKRIDTLQLHHDGENALYVHGVTIAPTAGVGSLAR